MRFDLKTLNEGESSGFVTVSCIVTFDCKSKIGNVIFCRWSSSDEKAFPGSDIIYADRELHILDGDFVHRELIEFFAVVLQKYSRGVAISQSEVPVDGCDYQRRVNYCEFSIKSAYSLPWAVGRA